MTTARGGRAQQETAASHAATAEIEAGDVLGPSPVEYLASSETPATGDDPPRGRRWQIFVVVSFALLMTSIDQTIVATALHTIQRDLDAPINWGGWTITIYALGQIVSMPLAGRLSDQYGRKRVFLSAACLFTVASLCCSLSDNIGSLIAFRLLQSLGGGAFMPSAVGIIAEQFGGGRDRAIGMFSSIIPIGGVIGPIIGGVMVSYWSWRGIFLVNVPIGICLIIAAIKVIPRDLPRSANTRIDAPGAAIFAIAIAATMFGITHVGTNPVVSDPIPWIMLGIAVAAIYLLAIRSSRIADPFLPVALLRGRGFGAINLINLLYGTVIFGLGTLVPLYAQEHYGISVLTSGTLLTARSIGMICLAGLAVLALRRTGYRIPMIAGFIATVVGLMGMGSTPLFGTPQTWLTVTAGITGIGMGLSIPASNNAGLQFAPDQAAAMAGLRGMLRQAGGIFTVSIVTAVLATSDNPGATLGHSFLVLACILLVTTPLVMLVPNHRGRW